MRTAEHERQNTAPDPVVESAVLWCDLDGEFLTSTGHRSLRCAHCRRTAMVRRDDTHLCDQHLGGLTIPEWLRVLTPRPPGS